MLSSMAFAYNYFNISKNEIQGDINVGKSKIILSSVLVQCYLVLVK